MGYRGRNTTNKKWPVKTKRGPPSLKLDMEVWRIVIPDVQPNNNSEKRGGQSGITLEFTRSRKRAKPAVASRVQRRVGRLSPVRKDWLAIRHSQESCSPKVIPIVTPMWLHVFSK
jgi:hypothetical protein